MVSLDIERSRLDHVVMGGARVNWSSLGIAVAFAALSAGLTGGCGGDGNKNGNVACTGGACAIGGSPGSGGVSGGGGGAAGVSAGMAGTGAGGQSAAPTLCPTTGSRLSETGTLPDGAALVRGLPVDAELLFLHATETHVYWGSNRSLHRTSLADGTDQVLYEPGDFTIAVEGFDLAGDTLYFTESGSGARGIAKMPADGSAPPTTVLAENSVNLAVVSDGFLYYTSLARHRVARVPLAGGTPTDIVAANPDPRALLVVGGFVWFRLGNDDNSHLVRARVETNLGTAGAGGGGSGMGGGGGAADGGEIIATSHLRGADPVSDGSNVYYGDNERLMKVPVAGGTPSELGVTTPLGGPLPTIAVVSSILPLSSGILWAQEGCADVYRVKPDGTVLPPLLHNARAGRLLANSGSVFVTSGNQMLKVASP